MSNPVNHPLSCYVDPASSAPVFCLRAKPRFSPLDVNVAFLARSGWNQSVDHLRFHTQQDSKIPAGHPMAQVISQLDPHLLIRRLDRDEDRFISVHASVLGEIVVLSNHADFARECFRGIFLECPPSFHTVDDFEVTEEWRTDDQTKGLFAGMLAGAQGWDPSRNIPENIQQSLDEAKRSLEIANYRSCVAMSRRTLEGVLKFGYQRLLKKQPTNKKGHGLMLKDMIQEFRKQKPSQIPEHLLHVADSIRVIGNVPGAHAADIAGYHFSRSDAEFALYATTHFLEQYFSKIDKEVTQYYTLTIDLSDPGRVPDQTG
ncbi:MAG: DUF4145 domain-containing protein [Terriglobia bacterium]